MQQESKGKIDHSAVSVKENTNFPFKRKTEQKPSVKMQPPAKKRRQNAPEVEETKSDFGRKELESEDQREKEEGKGKEIERSKAEFYNDQCTAFISNLNLRVSLCIIQLCEIYFVNVLSNLDTCAKKICILAYQLNLGKCIEGL
jgi:hypothetical protein